MINTCKQLLSTAADISTGGNNPTCLPDDRNRGFSQKKLHLRREMPRQGNYLYRIASSATHHTPLFAYQKKKGLLCFSSILTPSTPQYSQISQSKGSVLQDDLHFKHWNSQSLIDGLQIRVPTITSLSLVHLLKQLTLRNTHTNLLQRLS